MSVGSIVSELTSLNQHDLELVQKACERLRENMTWAAGPCFDHLRSTANSKVTWSAFTKTKVFKKWQENEILIFAFIDKNWPYASKVTINALKYFLFYMLADDLKRRKIRITIGTLALNAGDIPSLFEHNFPGYIGAGLAPMVLMAMVAKNGNGAA